MPMNVKTAQIMHNAKQDDPSFMSEFRNFIS
jgi:hypothetical protein